LTGRSIALFLVIYLLAITYSACKGKLGMSRPGVFEALLVAALATFFGSLAACGRIGL